MKSIQKLLLFACIILLAVSVVQASPYIDAKKEYQNKLTTWNSFREEFRATRADKDNPKAFGAAKDYLTASADKLIAHMDFLKEKLEGSPVSSLTQRSLSQQMQNYQDELIEVKAQITMSEDKLDILAAAKELRMTATDVQSLIKETGYHMMLIELGNLVEHIQRLAGKTKVSINDLKLEGRSTTGLDEKQGDLEKQLRHIRSNYEQMQHDFEDVKGKTDKNKQMRNIFGILTSTIQKLKVFENDLNDLNAEIRGESS